MFLGLGSDAEPSFRPGTGAQGPADLALPTPQSREEAYGPRTYPQVLPWGSCFNLYPLPRPEGAGSLHVGLLLRAVTQDGARAG